MRTDRRTVLPAEGRPFAWNIPRDFDMAERCCDSWAEADPDRLALIDIAADGSETRWSHGDLRFASDRLARVMADHGICAGDRVALLLGQGAAAILGHLAAWKLGAISLPLFTLFGPDALRYRLADSRARLAIAEGEALDRVLALTDALDDLDHVLSAGDAVEGAPSIWDDIAHADPIAPHRNAADDPAVMIYTSGTTGPPKGVLHAHRFLMGHLPCMETCHPDLPDNGDVGWTPADWAWIGGLMDLAMPCLFYGIPVVAHRMRKFDAADAWAIIARHRVTRIFAPPTALRLMQQADVPSEVAIRSIASGGESLGDALAGWADDALGATLSELYGQTECNLVVAGRCGTGPLGAMGRAVPGHRVSIIGPDGAEMPTGQEGEIAISRPDPAMFLLYWNQPEKTEAKFTGDWMRTGDLGRMDENGFVTFVSRDDDVITSSGYRIGPTEIETCLTSHPDVAMAAVVGLPDPRRTEAVTGFVVLRAGAEAAGIEAELIALVRQRISPHLAPRRIVLLDSLPMTATGKIMRRTLRERYSTVTDFARLRG